MPAGPGRDPAVSLHLVHLLDLGRLPVEQHADPHGGLVVPDWLHGWDAGPLAVVHLRAAALPPRASTPTPFLGRVPAERHADPHRRHVRSDRMHGHAGPSQSCTYVPPPPTCTVVHLLGLRRLPVEQHPDAHRADLVPDGLHGRHAGPLAGLHLRPAGDACTSFTYSAFGACQSNNTQTRTVLTSSPTGCTGGTPVLTQACTYVPPANSARRSPTRPSAPASRTTRRRAPC